MMGSFASGATTSLVAKHGTKQLSPPFEDGFGCSRYLNDHLKVDFWMLLLKRGPKAPRRALLELEGARRRGA